MREKLIELIQSAVGGCAEYWAMVIADYLISNGVTVQEWIPADNHPKEAGEYNVQIKGTEVATTLFYSIISKKWYEFSDDEHEHPYEITHWMPLPQPPKGE